MKFEQKCNRGYSVSTVDNHGNDMFVGLIERYEHQCEFVPLVPGNCFLTAEAMKTIACKMEELNREYGRS